MHQWILMGDVYDMKMHERLDEQTSMQWALFEIHTYERLALILTLTLTFICTSQSIKSDEDEDMREGGGGGICMYVCTISTTHSHSHSHLFFLSSSIAFIDTITSNLLTEDNLTNSHKTNPLTLLYFPYNYLPFPLPPFLPFFFSPLYTHHPATSPKPSKRAKENTKNGK